MKIATWWLTAAVWMMLTSAALAEGPKRVVILPFRGPAQGVAHKYVVAGFHKNPQVELVSIKRARGVARKAGMTLGSPESFVTVGRELHVSAFIEGVVVRDRGHFIATLKVRDASTGQVTKSQDFPRKKPSYFRSLKTAFFRVLGPAVMATRVPGTAAAPAPQPAPPPEEPEEEEEEPEEEEEEPEEEEEEEEPARGERRSALRVDILPGMLWRTLKYRDADTSLRDYRSGGPAFVIGGKVEWYPGAHFTTSRVGDLGIEAAASGAIGLESSDGVELVDTVTWKLQGGLVFRMPIGVFVPKLRAGYAKQLFNVDVDPNAVPLPDVNYSSLRFGAGCAFQLTDGLELEVGIAYLYVLDAGQISSNRYFPNETVGAIDLDASLAYQFIPWMGVVAGVDYRRYGHDFQADPSFMQVGGQKLAGGAVDQYVEVNLGLRFLLDGR